MSVSIVCVIQLRLIVAAPLIGERGLPARSFRQPAKPLGRRLRVARSSSAVRVVGWKRENRGLEARAPLIFR